MNDFSFKHKLKRTISLFYPSKSQKDSLTILTYHSVHPENWCSIGPEDFAFQMRYLKENFKIVNLSKFVFKERDFSDKALVSIIFDDGYEDNYFYAFPILKKLNIPATIAVTTDFVFRGYLVNKNWHFYSDLSPLKEEQIKEMLKSGLISIASHGKTHRRLSELSENELRKEICLSKKELEERLSTPVSVFVYPFGQRRDFSPMCIEVLKKCYYKLACTNIWGVNNLNALKRFCLKRIEITYLDNKKDFINKLKGKWDFISYWQTLKRF